MPSKERQYTPCGMRELVHIASTRRYYKSELMPLHPACDCSVLPIPKGAPAGVTFDQETLAAAHSSISDTFGADSTAARRIGDLTKTSNGEPLLYRDVLVTHEHSEIGPVLAIRGQTFTSY